MSSKTQGRRKRGGAGRDDRKIIQRTKRERWLQARRTHTLAGSFSRLAVGRMMGLRAGCARKGAEAGAE